VRAERKQGGEFDMFDAIVWILRLIHIVVGAFWVGGAITTAFFILPTVQATGPIGGQFAGQVMARTRLPTVLVAAGGIAVLAGIILYVMKWAPGGFAGPAVYYAIGGVIAIIVLIIGGTVSRPAADMLSTLGQKIASQGSPPTAEQTAER